MIKKRSNSMSLFYLLVLIGILFQVGIDSVSARIEDFPCPSELKPKVEFWKNIYSQYTTKQGVLHDSEDMSVIYENIYVGDIAEDRRALSNRVKKNKQEYKKLLDSIIKKKGELLSPREKKIYNQFTDKSLERLKLAKNLIRFQLGQRDRFLQGLKLSYRYLNYIKEMIVQAGAPEEIMYLPHVESSFNYKAYSKFGAAGIWQFTRGTGKRYLEIGYVYDERLDPLKSTQAAIQHLMDNYTKLQAWPLAITAYNHGVAGMKRAVADLNTTDIVKIITDYDGKSFGFASKNFYCEFLAACEVAKNYKDYFGDVELEEPLEYQSYKLKKAVFLKDIIKSSGIDKETIARYNPALRKPGLQSKRCLPKNFTLNFPGNKDYSLANNLLETCPLSEPILLTKLVTNPQAPEPALQAKLPLESKIMEKFVDILIKPVSKSDVTLVPKKEDSSTKNNLSLASKDANQISLKIEWTDEDYKNRYSTLLTGNNSEQVSLKIGVDETISHYAEWAKTSTSEIKRTNRIGKSLQTGKVIKIRLKGVSKEDFEEARIDYHKGIEEDFFDNYQIDDTNDYTIKRGDSLWLLCLKKFAVPPWLIERYNSNINFDNLQLGSKLVVPVVVGKVLN
ncbi:MAG: transglycosylase SLT domain-containing protein [bacterium]